MISLFPIALLVSISLLSFDSSSLLFFYFFVNYFFPFPFNSLLGYDIALDAVVPLIMMILISLL